MIEQVEHIKYLALPLDGKILLNIHITQLQSNLHKNVRKFVFLSIVGENLMCYLYFALIEFRLTLCNRKLERVRQEHSFITRFFITQNHLARILTIKAKCNSVNPLYS